MDPYSLPTPIYRANSVFVQCRTRLIPSRLSRCIHHTPNKGVQYPFQLVHPFVRATTPRHAELHRFWHTARNETRFFFHLYSFKSTRSGRSRLNVRKIRETIFTDLVFCRIFSARCFFHRLVIALKIEMLIVI